MGLLDISALQTLTEIKGLYPLIKDSLARMGIHSADQLAQEAYSSSGYREAKLSQLLEFAQKALGELPKYGSSSSNLSYTSLLKIAGLGLLNKGWGKKMAINKIVNVFHKSGVKNAGHIGRMLSSGANPSQLKVLKAGYHTAAKKVPIEFHPSKNELNSIFT